MMFRSLIGLASALVCAAPAAAGIPVTLNADLTDAGAQVTLGELFDGAGPARDVVVATRSGPTVVGQLQIATFLNDAGLEADGNNLYTESAASGPATAANPGTPGYGVTMQGYTEASNVDPVSEITNLIIAQRAYEMNSKVVTTADQMLSTAVNTKS